VTLRKVRADVVINYAWHIDNLWQVSTPGNMPLERWDIEAETAGAPDEDTPRLMFQAMLEDRFRVKAHYEQRELDQWDLVVSKRGKSKAPNPETTMTLSGRPVPPAPGLRIPSAGYRRRPSRTRRTLTGSTNTTSCWTRALLISLQSRTANWALN